MTCEAYSVPINPWQTKENSLTSSFSLYLFDFSLKNTHTQNAFESRLKKG